MRNKEGFIGWEGWLRNKEVYIGWEDGWELRKDKLDGKHE